jgi:hypothetical protein
MEKGESQRAVLKEFLGEPLRTELKREIEPVEIEDIERELNRSGRVSKLEDDNLITTEEILGETEETARKMDASLMRRVE